MSAIKLLSKFVCSLLCVTMLWFQGYSQKRETYDIATFTPPPGWESEVKPTGKLYQKFDAAKQTFGMTILHQSTKGTNNIAVDFQNEWNSKVTRVSNVTLIPESVLEDETDGWKIRGGAGLTSVNSIKLTVLLLTFSGYGKVFSIVSTYTGNELPAELKAFMDSIDLSKPTENTESQDEVQNEASQAGSNSTGISKTKTDFGNGWISMIQPGYVHISGGSINVYQFFPVEMTDEMRGPSTVPEEYFWKRFVQPNFSISSPRWVNLYPGRVLEGEGVDSGTGKQIFLVLYLDTTDGWAKTLIFVTPNKQTFLTAFPDYKGLDTIAKYNHFAVTADELVGQWGERFTGTTSYYNRNNGSYQGMSTTSSSNHLTFSANGRYNWSWSEGKFDRGVGSSNQTQNTGIVSVTDWEITLTDKNKGENTVYLAHFEAIDGGRILHLTNKNATGLKYVLKMEN